MRTRTVVYLVEDPSGANCSELRDRCCPEGFQFVGMAEGQVTTGAVCLEPAPTGRLVLRVRDRPDANDCGGGRNCCPEELEHIGYSPNESVCIGPIEE